MNKLYILVLSILSLGVVTSCSDWNDDESVKINVPKDPEYDTYLENLRAYKQTDHNYIYAWFDNSQKTPASRADHMSDVPDSIDVVVVKNPANLENFEMEDIRSLQNVKGTKVVIEINFNTIQALYNAQNQESGVESLPFLEFLQESVNNMLPLVSQYDYDGVIVGYEGKSTLHMPADELSVYTRNQDAFISTIKEWMANNTDKMISFKGTPQFLFDKEILISAKHIIINTVENKSQQSLTLSVLESLVDNVPTDKFIVVAPTVPAIDDETSTGYYANNNIAILEAANWVSVINPAFTKAGLAIDNIQNDYYHSSQIYMYVRDAINTITPAPKN